MKAQFSGSRSICLTTRLKPFTAHRAIVYASQLYAELLSAVNVQSATKTV